MKHQVLVRMWSDWNSHTGGRVESWWAASTEANCMTPYELAVLPPEVYPNRNEYSRTPRHKECSQ